jgi:hypothetical protein
MRGQLQYIIRIAETQPHVTIRVFPFTTGMVTGLMPRSQLILFTFPDPADPPMAVAEMVSADLFYTSPSEVSRYQSRYGYVRNEALSEVSSLTLLSELADQIID